MDKQAKRQTERLTHYVDITFFLRQMAISNYDVKYALSLLKLYARLATVYDNRSLALIDLFRILTKSCKFEVVT